MPERPNGAVLKLVISPRTVAKHLQRIYEKLGVAGRRAARALIRTQEVAGSSPASS